MKSYLVIALSDLSNASKTKSSYSSSHALLFTQVYPMYKAFIEPDLETAHIKIINKFNPFTGFQNPTYILKVKSNSVISMLK